MKRLKYLLVAVTITVLFIGCSSKNINNEITNEAIPHTEIIEVYKDGKTELLETMTSDEEITDFITQFQLEEWEINNVSEDAVEETIYKMFDRKTAKLTESIEDTKRYHSRTLIDYKNEPYIEFITKFFALSMKIPAEVQKSLLK